MMNSVERNFDQPNYMVPTENGQLRYLQIHLLRNVIASFVILSSLLSTLADKPANSKDQAQLQCTIGNRKIQFTDYLKVSLTEDETVSIFGMGKAHEHLSLSLPILKKGTFTLQDTPAMRLRYSRNLASSTFSDHFDTAINRSFSKLKVTISNLDTKSGWIEGTFSSTAHTIPSRKVSIKDGSFKLRFQRESTDKKQKEPQPEALKFESISENAFVFNMGPNPLERSITEFRLTLK